MWKSVPDALRAFDVKTTAQVSEPVVVQLLWVCLAYMEGFATDLDLPAGERWRLGGRGQGDLLCREDDEDSKPVLAHLEVKSYGAASSYGASCAHKCAVHQSQLAHAAHDVGAIIVTLTHTRRVPAVRRMISEAGLDSRSVQGVHGRRVQGVPVLTFARAADAAARSLATHGPPAKDLMRSLLDVE